jgi:hypothetical protein
MRRIIWSIGDVFTGFCFLVCMSSCVRWSRPRYANGSDNQYQICWAHPIKTWPPAPPSVPTGPGSREPDWTRPTNSTLTGETIFTISSCMIDENFLPKVEHFIQRHQLTPTTFGLWAMNDSRFVFDLRNGRECFGVTIRRVYRFMAEYEIEQEARHRRMTFTAKMTA